MTRKTRKNKRGGFSFSKKKTKQRRSSSEKRSNEKRKKNLQFIMKERKINNIKYDKCLVQFNKCMGVSRRRTI